MNLHNNKNAFRIITNFIFQGGLYKSKLRLEYL